MTPLRAKYLRDMTLRGLAERTRQSYLSFVRELAGYYRRSPEEISYEAVADWLYFLIEERKLAPSSVNIAVNAVRFLYLTTLGRDVGELMAVVPRMKRPTPRAEAYACSEVERIVLAAQQPRDRAFLAVVYACGLRLMEATALKITDIDRARMVLRVRHGKGGKGRVLPLSAMCLQELEAYWLAQRRGQPGSKSPWLFLGNTPEEPLTRSAGQSLYYRAVKRSGVRRKGGIHVLRHSFATHSIENGLPLVMVQRQLGHTALATTARYLHVTALRRGPLHSALNLIEVSRTSGEANEAL